LARKVVIVISIKRRKQWSRVDYQRHERGSGRISPESLAVS
jgi:hypothetical protein